MKYENKNSTFFHIPKLKHKYKFSRKSLIHIILSIGKKYIIYLVSYFVAEIVI